MTTRAFDTRAALLESGMREFLAKGFDHASLRSICRAAHVTTGALYAHFESKEALARAIVEPQLAEYFSLYDSMESAELADGCMFEESDLVFMDFILARRDLFRFLFLHAQGSPSSPWTSRSSAWSDSRRTDRGRRASRRADRPFTLGIAPSRRYTHVRAACEGVRMDDFGLPYDKMSVESIYDYALRLEGHTLRELIELGHIDNPRRRRGAFGSAVEECYFRIPANSSPKPDFEEVGLELKTTPIKRNKDGSISSKERLVLTMINYTDVVDETFETSHLFEKSKDILLISYLWEEDKDPLDYEIKLVTQWGLPEEDLEQISHDWSVVVEKVRTGHAEDISSSDTLYLEACTKGVNGKSTTPQPFSDVPAKPRAWAFKQSYMTAVSRALLDERYRQIKRSEQEHGLDLLSLVRARFKPYFGMSPEELAREFGVTHTKDMCARITKHILGMSEDDKIAEFEKAGIKPKTIRLSRLGRPKEDVSFPRFDYSELERRDFEESDFLGYLEQKYLFVLYHEVGGGRYELFDVCFWQMPDEDLAEAKRCFDQMRENVRQGRADISVTKKENRCCHVRPHGRNGSDRVPQPHGAPVAKKCFWLNAGYLKEEIAKALGGAGE